MYWSYESPSIQKVDGHSRLLDMATHPFTSMFLNFIFTDQQWTMRMKNWRKSVDL